MLVEEVELSGWSAEIRNLILLALFTLAGELLFQTYLLFFAIGVSALVIWYLLQLSSIRSKLQGDAELSATHGSGLLPGLSRQISTLQQRVREQEQYNTQVVSLFRKAFEAFPDAVMILRPNWQIRWCNRAGREMFGLDPESENIGSLIDETGHPVLQEYLEAGDLLNRWSWSLLQTGLESSRSS